MMRVNRAWSPVVVVLLAACGAARGNVEAPGLALTAYGAWGEARGQAFAWASDSRLQYVEGASVTNRGTVMSDAGYWRFVYGSPSRTTQYVVTVTPTSVDGAERTPQGPPGFVLGDASLGTDWIDSPRVVDALAPFGDGTRVHMFLVPTTPPRWIVGDVEIDARTGEVLE
jgi:hypothetical protein